jgi:hypothetical protein
MIWQGIGSFPPGELVPARLQLHHAVQIVAAAAITRLPAADHDSHPNMGGDEALGALVGRRLPATGSSAGLRVAQPTLLVRLAPAQPDPAALPTFADGGVWHTKGFTSAILCGDDVAALPADARCDRVHDFLSEAIAVSHGLLDA